MFDESAQSTIDIIADSMTFSMTFVITHRFLLVDLRHLKPAEGARAIRRREYLACLPVWLLDGD